MTRLLVGILVFVLKIVYRNRPIPRFYVLETVARVPYFSYLSVLHLYETIGLWRRADWLKIHFAESWNELHHLLIMEELGGNEKWVDRFLARHVALLYYWIIVVLYVLSPNTAYHFMELVEQEAYHTYNQFLKDNADELKLQAAPSIAISYYRDGDLYMFDEFQTSHPANERRPRIDNLYDVFIAIRDDEMEHVKTMVACQDSSAKTMLTSPHSETLEATPHLSITN